MFLPTVKYLTLIIINLGLVTLEEKVKQKKKKTLFFFVFLKGMKIEGKKI